MSKTPRILIIRLSALGDVVHGLPVLAALREAFPAAWIGWAAEPAAAALLDGHPSLDRLHRIPRKWLRHPLAWRGLRRELTAENYDTTLDLQGLAKSALLGRFGAGARRRIGFARPDARELAPWCYTDRIHPPDQLAHVVDRQLRLLEPLGLEPPPPAAVRFELPDRPEARAAVDRRMADWGWREKRFAVISAGGGWPAKLWPAGRYGAVAAGARRLWGMPALVTWSGPAERERAEHIAAVAGHGDDGRPAARPAPATTLPELVEWLRAAAVFVGPDTGPMHLAIAAGTDVVGLYGPTLAVRSGAYAPASGTMPANKRPRQVILQGRSPVSPTNPLRPPPRGVNHVDGRAICGIEPAEVLAALETLFTATTGK